jgi:hypothetical protein
LAKKESNTLAVLLLLGLVALLVIQSGVQFQYANPVRFSFTLAVGACVDQDGYLWCPTGSSGSSTSTLSIDVFQEWMFFNRFGQQIKTLRSDVKTFGFQLATTQLPISELGFIRLNEHHVLKNDVPMLSLGVYSFTTRTAGQLLIDGQRYADVTLMPWPTPSGLSEYLNGLYFPNLEGENAAFTSGDKAGTSRDGTFYLIFDKALMPRDCNTFPSGCVDLSSFVSQGRDVTVSAAFQETWTEWSQSTDPLKTAFGPCDYTADLFNVGGSFVCIKRESVLGPTPVSMDPVLLSRLMTQTASTFASNTVFFSTTTTLGKTITQWGIEYSNTTTTGIVTYTPANIPGLPDFCSWIPWLCDSTWGLPNWILVAVAIVFLWLLFRRGNGSGQVVVVSGKA